MLAGVWIKMYLALAWLGRLLFPWKVPHIEATCMLNTYCVDHKLYPPPGPVKHPRDVEGVDDIIIDIILDEEEEELLEEAAPLDMFFRGVIRAPLQQRGPNSH